MAVGFGSPLLPKDIVDAAIPKLRLRLPPEPIYRSESSIPENRHRHH
jgi:hypothetical protein